MLFYAPRNLIRRNVLISISYADQVNLIIFIGEFYKRDIPHWFIDVIHVVRER